MAREVWTMEDMNELHAVIRVGGKVCILNHEVDPITGAPDFTLSTKADFLLLHANHCDFDERDKPIAPLWLADEARAEYGGITFSPVRETRPDYYNLWQGFGVKPSANGKCDLFLAHIRDNIANGDADHYRYIMTWLARLVQQPWNRAGISLVLRGTEGVGKGYFVNMIGKLFGRHYVPVTQMNHLIGRFNGHLKYGLLVFVDEAFWKGGNHRAAAGLLKTLITEPTFLVEPKNFDAFPLPNFTHFIIASNEDWAVPVGLDARRFAAFDVSPAHQNDRAYFAAIDKQMMLHAGLPKLLHVLQTYDISKVNLHVVPKTAALAEMKKLSMDSVQAFLLDLVENEFSDPHFERLPDGSLWINAKTFYQLYVAHTPMNERESNVAFGIAITKLLPISNSRDGRRTVAGQRRPGHYIAPIKACRAAFEKKLGDVNWE